MFLKKIFGSKGDGKRGLNLSLSKYIEKEIPESFSSSEDALNNLKHVLKPEDFERVLKESWDDYCDSKGYGEDKRSLGSVDEAAGTPLNFSSVPEKNIKEYLSLITEMFGVVDVYGIQMNPTDSIRMIAHNLDKHFNPFELNYKK